MKQEEILNIEAKGCFDFFWNEANTDPASPGYGLIRDNTAVDTRDFASIASVGFGLSAIIIGIERDWISFKDGKKRVLGTMKTFWNNAEHSEGFFYHFLNLQTAKKFEASYDCASIIDTSIFLNGALTAAEYFGGEIEALFEKIYRRVDWTKYYDEARNMYFMGYNPETGGFGAWDMYAEQMMQYILGVGSPTHAVPAQIYDGFERSLVTYGDYTFYNSPGGPLFTHQFSHAWFDFRDVRDVDGVDWFANSVAATLAQREYAMDNPDQRAGYHGNSWGVTACQGPNGYVAYGTPPYKDGIIPEGNDGTIAPAAAAGSIVFTPKETLDMMWYLYENMPELWDQYGMLDAYNLEGEKAWYADRVIGIDKGVTLLMIENYQTGLIWELYGRNHYVKKAAGMLGLERVDA
ncbi:glucoamylase family protein [Listeria booriae]|uniref:glucoamylase family protein n=1 Tax=Listeria booriae TaxID=1552123 RepID=UPI00163DCB2C|nr:glucoamylase family protein [Listeria booriae]MBC1306395.1 hypothetical protein [Listeria booriae]